MDKDSKEAKKFVKDQEEAATANSSATVATKRPGGLASIMNVISGKLEGFLFHFGIWNG